MTPRALPIVVLASLALGFSACAGGAPATTAIPDEEPTLGQVSLALLDTDPVSAAVGASCSTTSVKGLATQLVAEIQCMRPGSMKSIDGIAGLSLGAAVFPFLQTPAADALIAAQKDRGTTMSINSALRTLPQQYLLYRWYKTGLCGISLAATPGTSNHEGALAVDIADEQGWRPAMTTAGFTWLGASDPVHFDYTGAGAIDLGGLSVTAFQRLWNLNHPEDPIGEDGSYGTETEKRLALAPVGGFPRGADCGADAGASPPDAAAPDAAAADAAAPINDGVTSSRTNVDNGGCSLAAAPTRGDTGLASIALVAFALVAGACRRRLARSVHFTSRSSTSNTSTDLGGITGGMPRSP
jgi:hypothetical protein